MAAKSNFYNRHIATGSGILIFSILFAAIIRFFYFLNFGISEAESHNSLVWGYFAPLFNNPFTSFVCSTASVAFLAFFASHTDTKHLLIRQKTYLPATFIILLFSSHPSFMAMTGELISSILIAAMLSTLFSLYNTPHKQHAAFRVSLTLALAGLFSTTTLFYLPLLWIGLGIMRLLNFRALMASAFGLFIVYFPFFSYFLLTDNIDVFITSFTDISSITSKLPILDYEIKEWVTMGLSAILLLITISDDYINRHKDKIRVRNYFNLLILFNAFALLGILFIHLNPSLHTFIAFITGAFILAHFFALAERKATFFLFYLSLLLFIAITIFPFFSIN